jgi:nucleotide-binding universal stress UspA family protein
MENSMFKTVVWANDGSAAAERAMPFAKGIAQANGGRLIVVFVNEIKADSRAALATAIADIEDEELAAVRRQAEALQQDGIAVEFVTGDVMVGGVARVIADLARDANADLIVTGTRGRNPLVGLLVGSVTSRLLEVAPCPVLAVPSTQPQSTNS